MMDQTVDSTTAKPLTSTSVPRNACPVIGCNSSIDHLNLWKQNHAKTSCPDSSNCRCPAPYSFLPFPKEEEERYQWTKIINRKDTSGKGGLMNIPKGTQLICSRHFLKGCKLPLFCLGYGKKPLTREAELLVFDVDQIPPMIQNIESRTMKVRIPFSLAKGRDAPHSTVIFIDRTSKDGNVEKGDEQVKRFQLKSSAKKAAPSENKSESSSVLAETNATTSRMILPQTTSGSAVDAPMKRYAKIQRIASRNCPSEIPAVADGVNSVCCACRNMFDVTSLNANQGVLSKICVIMQLRTVPEEILSRQICAECCSTVNKAFDIVSNVMQASNGDNGPCGARGPSSKGHAPPDFGHRMAEVRTESTSNLSDLQNGQNDVPDCAFNSLNFAANSQQRTGDHIIVKREVFDEVVKEPVKVSEKVTEAQFEIKQEILDDSYGDIIKEEITEALGAIYGTDLIANNESFEKNRTEELGRDGSALNYGSQNEIVRSIANNPVPNASKPIQKRRKRTPKTPLSAASQLETLRSRGTIQITKANPGKGRRRKTAEKVLDSEFWTELGRVGKTGPVKGNSSVPTGMKIQRARACTTPFSDEMTPDEPVCKKIKSESENEAISGNVTQGGVKMERNSAQELRTVPSNDAAFASSSDNVVNEITSHDLGKGIECSVADSSVCERDKSGADISTQSCSKRRAQKTVSVKKACNVFMRYTDFCRVRCKHCPRTFLGYSRLAKHKQYFHTAEKPRNSHHSEEKPHSSKRKIRKAGIDKKTQDTTRIGTNKTKTEVSENRQFEEVPPSLVLRSEQQCTHTGEKPQAQYSHTSEKPLKSESEFTEAKTDQFLSNVALKAGFSVQAAAQDYYESIRPSRPLPSTEIIAKNPGQQERQKIFVENCRICSQDMYQTSWKHARMHAPGYGPFKCESCQLYFKTKNPHTKHMNSFHGTENLGTLSQNLSNPTWEKDAMKPDRSMKILNPSMIGTRKPESVLQGLKIVRASKV